MGTMRKNLLTFAVFSILFVILMLSYVFKLHKYPFWINEGGIIESLSAAGYFICAAFMLYMGGLNHTKRYYYIFFFVILLGLRELDFDKKFTTMGILKSKFYVSNQVPLIEKIIGLCVIIFLLHLVYSILSKHLRSFIQQLSVKNPVIVGVSSVIFLLFFTKSIDGIGRKLNSIGLDLSNQSSVYFKVTEEVLEMGIPMLILSTLFTYFSIKRNTPDAMKRQDMIGKMPALRR